MKKVKVKCKLCVTEKWSRSWLVDFPISAGAYEVDEPLVPDGFKLVSIGIGVNYNSTPPRATKYLKPIDPDRIAVTRTEANLAVRSVNKLLK